MKHLKNTVRKKSRAKKISKKKLSGSKLKSRETVLSLKVKLSAAYKLMRQQNSALLRQYQMLQVLGKEIYRMRKIINNDQSEEAARAYDCLDS